MLPLNPDLPHSCELCDPIDAGDAGTQSESGGDEMKVESYLNGPAYETIDEIVRVDLAGGLGPAGPIKKTPWLEGWNFGGRLAEGVDWHAISMSPGGTSGEAAKAFWRSLEDGRYQVQIDTDYLTVNREELPAAICQALLRDYRAMKAAILAADRIEAS